jgi:hypothetical protein
MHPSKFPNPEARPSLLRVATRLPLLAYRMLRWRALRGAWLGNHLRGDKSFDRRSLPAGKPIDIMVLVTDHYEPARRHGDEAAVESVRSWCAEYERMAERHSDSDGRPPQHTWFYRYDYPNEGCLRELSASTFRGFGEVEFHLHHGHDTHHSFAGRLATGRKWFARFGALRSAEVRPQSFFGYIAGNSALDNGSGDDSLSGCDTELTALREAGCYADFTFPSLGSPAQPSVTNRIYYATEDGGPRSHASGTPLAVGRSASGDLPIFLGPVGFNWGDGYSDDGTVENSSPGSPRRLGTWLRSHVHVPGRPEWVFIKLTTHAMQSRASFLGQTTDDMFAAMEYWWKRPPYRLHYVTAREAFNIAKAAEAGHSGNPDDYRDFRLPKPANRVVCCDRPWELLSYSAQRCHLRVLEAGKARIEFADGPIRSVEGWLGEVDLVSDRGVLVDCRLEGKGSIRVTGRDGQTSHLRADERAPSFDWNNGPSAGGHALLDTKAGRT